MAKDLSKTIIELLEGTSKNLKAQPLNLGGFGGGAGGVGSPPGGYIGWLPQTRVAYDEVEAATLATNPSGFNPPSGWSLLDNLNHIRYRLNTLEAGSGVLVVDELDGSPSVNLVQQLTFSGAIVTELAPGHALVQIVASGGGGLDTAAGDARYLKLDATNDPVVGQLAIDVNSLAGSSEAALTISLDDTVTFGYGLYVEAAGNIPAYLIAHEGYDGIYIDQQLDSTGDKGGAAQYISRYSTGASNIVQTQHAIIISDDSTGVTFSGGTLKHTYDYSRSMVNINPYVAPAGTMVVFDSLNAITQSGRLLSLKNQQVEKFYVTGSGLVNIPAGQTYNIGGSPHTHFNDAEGDPSAIGTTADGTSEYAARRDHVHAHDGTAWTAYTPTVAAGAGTITSYSAEGAYKRVGKAVFVRIKVTITTNGTGSGHIQVSLPIDSADQYQTFAGKEAGVTSKTLNASLYPNAYTIAVAFYDGTYPGQDGAILAFSGLYEGT